MSSENVHSEIVSWPTLGCLRASIPKPTAPSDTTVKVTIAEDVTYAPAASIPTRIQDPVDWNKLHVKQKIQPNIGSLTPLQLELLSVMNNYQDLYYPERTLSTGEQLRLTYCLHVVNHVLKSRLKVVRHNARLQAKKMDIAEDDEFRDQGLVRPKVLILLPFKEAALRLVSNLLNVFLFWLIRQCCHILIFQNCQHASFNALGYHKGDSDELQEVHGGIWRI